MDPLRYESRPALTHPVVVGAFHGWNDASDAATMAVEFLTRRLDATPFAEIDPEEFYDFQYHRPRISIGEDGVRRVDWPRNTFSHASIPDAGRDVVILDGVEPSVRWRTYCDAVVQVARDAGAELVVTLGALLANRPHTRPVRVTGTSVDPDLAARLGLAESRYEGPTGIVGVLHDACRRAGVPAVSLWAWVPAYLQSTPSPPAALELLRRLGKMLDLPLDLAELETSSGTYHERVAEALEADPESAAQVGELERISDEEELTDLPTVEELAAEVERFLRETGDDGS